MSKLGAAKKREQRQPEPEAARIIKAVCIVLGPHQPGFGRQHELVELELTEADIERLKVRKYPGNNLPGCLGRAEQILFKEWQ